MTWNFLFGRPGIPNYTFICHDCILLRGVDPNYISYCWWFRNLANQLRLVVYPIVCRVFYIPSGTGFLPSTVINIVIPYVTLVFQSSPKHQDCCDFEPPPKGFKSWFNQHLFNACKVGAYTPEIKHDNGETKQPFEDVSPSNHGDHGDFPLSS